MGMENLALEEKQDKCSPTTDTNNNNAAHIAISNGPNNSSNNRANNPQKKKRITKACQTCQRHKRKCDGLQPRCARCAKLDVECTYGETKKRGPPVGLLKKLKEEVKELRSQLEVERAQKRIKTESDSSAFSTSSASSLSAASSAASSCTLSIPSSTTLSSSATLNKEQDEIYLDAFFSASVHCLLATIIDQQTFRTQTKSESQLSWQLRKNAAIAFGALGKGDMEYAKKAATIAQDMALILLDQPHPEIVRGLVILAYVFLGTGLVSRAESYISIATQMTSRCEATEDLILFCALASLDHNPLLIPRVQFILSRQFSSDVPALNPSVIAQFSFSSPSLSSPPLPLSSSSFSSSSLLSSSSSSSSSTSASAASSSSASASASFSFSSSTAFNGNSLAENRDADRRESSSVVNGRSISTDNQTANIVNTLSASSSSESKIDPSIIRTKQLLSNTSDPIIRGTTPITPIEARALLLRLMTDVFIADYRPRSSSQTLLLLQKVEQTLVPGPQLFQVIIACVKCLALCFDSTAPAAEIEKAANEATCASILTDCSVCPLLASFYYLVGLIHLRFGVPSIPFLVSDLTLLQRMAQRWRFFPRVTQLLQDLQGHILQQQFTQLPNFFEQMQTQANFSPSLLFSNGTNDGNNGSSNNSNGNSSAMLGDRSSLRPLPTSNDSAIQQLFALMSSNASSSSLLSSSSSSSSSSSASSSSSSSSSSSIVPSLPIASIPSSASSLSNLANPSSSLSSSSASSSSSSNNSITPHPVNTVPPIQLEQNSAFKHLISQAPPLDLVSLNNPILSSLLSQHSSPGITNIIPPPLSAPQLSQLQLYPTLLSNNTQTPSLPNLNVDSAANANGTGASNGNIGYIPAIFAYGGAGGGVPNLSTLSTLSNLYNLSSLSSLSSIPQLTNLHTIPTFPNVNGVPLPIPVAAPTSPPLPLSSTSPSSTTSASASLSAMGPISVPAPASTPIPTLPSTSITPINAQQIVSNHPNIQNSAASSTSSSSSSVLSNIQSQVIPHRSLIPPPSQINSHLTPPRHVQNGNQSTVFIDNQPHTNTIRRSTSPSSDLAYSTSNQGMSLSQQHQTIHQGKSEIEMDDLPHHSHAHPHSHPHPHPHQQQSLQSHHLPLASQIPQPMNHQLQLQHSLLPQKQSQVIPFQHHPSPQAQQLPHQAPANHHVIQHRLPVPTQSQSQAQHPPPSHNNMVINTTAMNRVSTPPSIQLRPSSSSCASSVSSSSPPLSSSTAGNPVITDGHRGDRLFVLPSHPFSSSSSPSTTSIENLSSVPIQSGDRRFEWGMMTNSVSTPTSSSASFFPLTSTPPSFLTTIGSPFSAVTQMPIQRMLQTHMLPSPIRSRNSERVLGNMEHPGGVGVTDDSSMHTHNIHTPSHQPFPEDWISTL